MRLSRRWAGAGLGSGASPDDGPADDDEEDDHDDHVDDDFLCAQKVQGKHWILPIRTRSSRRCPPARWVAASLNLRIVAGWRVREEVGWCGLRWCSVRQCCSNAKRR